MRRGELYRVARPPARDPKRFRVFVVVSRQALIDSRFSTIICAPVYSTRHGLATQVDVGLNEGLRHHQTQVSRRCTDGCTGAAPQLERTSGWGYSLGANPIRRQEPRCLDRCCDSQRIRCARTALVFPVPRTGLPCSTNWFSLFPPENSLFRGVGNSKLKPHDISGLGGFDPAYSRPNPRNSLFFPCKTGKSGQRRVRSRLRPPPELGDTLAIRPPVRENIGLESGPGTQFGHSGTSKPLLAPLLLLRLAVSSLKYSDEDQMVSTGSVLN